MTRIFITGSSDGIGLLTARNLIAQGHDVYLHARNVQRASQTKSAAPGAREVLVADISTLGGMKDLADSANQHAPFDTVIHNAGIGYQEPFSLTEDKIAKVFAVNSLAPYVLTALIKKPKSQILYMSSGLHTGGDSSLSDVMWTKKRWSGIQAYSDSKLHNVMLGFAMARLWPDLKSNVVNPNWVRTKMGGAGAPGEVEAGADTLTWLAGEDGSGDQSGQYYDNRKAKRTHPDAGNVELQDKLLSMYEDISGVPRPTA